jgi:hypothetical protein
VFVRGKKFLVVLALVLSTGLHWAALQTVAWTTMLADNLRQHSLTEAVSQTFDGQHPCCLCKAIAAGKQSEKKTVLSFHSLKLECPPFNENFVLIAPAQFRSLPLENSSAKSLPQKPLFQPPRGFFV